MFTAHIAWNGGNAPRLIIHQSYYAFNNFTNQINIKHPPITYINKRKITRSHFWSTDCHSPGNPLEVMSTPSFIIIGSTTHTRRNFEMESLMKGGLAHDYSVTTSCCSLFVGISLYKMQAKGLFYFMKIDRIKYHWVDNMPLQNCNSTFRAEAHGAIIIGISDSC